MFRYYLSVLFLMSSWARRSPSSRLILTLDPWIWDRYVVPNYGFWTTLRLVISQWTEEYNRFKTTNFGKIKFIRLCRHQIVNNYMDIFIFEPPIYEVDNQLQIGAKVLSTLLVKELKLNFSFFINTVLHIRYIRERPLRRRIYIS
jgi:hypothetical protein